MVIGNRLGETALQELKAAALDTRPVSGLTHTFYRYPARFSPTFAATAVTLLSKPGDLVLDPYMGGATTIVEALRLGRRVAGSDLNSLAVFVARVKTTLLTCGERMSLKKWAEDVVPSLLYSLTPADLHRVMCPRRTKNLSLPLARPLKKVMALALLTIEEVIPTQAAQNFARCALLNVGQWALNGRRTRVSAGDFRRTLSATLEEMLSGMRALDREVRGLGATDTEPILINDSAENLATHVPFQRELADCVVCSPPYPGIHMLYHRWQVDGRKESAAPYWLANCQDGEGAAFYNFADRREKAIDVYFTNSLRTLKGIRKVMKHGAPIIQMIAFSDPSSHLPRYRENMRTAGFEEVSSLSGKIHRHVPSRRWHAAQKGRLNGSREVVLLHRAT